VVLLPLLPPNVKADAAAAAAAVVAGDGEEGVDGARVPQVRAKLAREAEALEARVHVVLHLLCCVLFLFWEMKVSTHS
jgi:hypothetical protein